MISCKKYGAPLIVLSLVCVSLMSAPTSVFAQKTYRCGNTYQSIPCTGADGKGGAVKINDSGGTQKPLVTGLPAKPATPAGSNPAGAAAVAGGAPQLSEADKKLAAAKQAEADSDKKNAAAAAEKKSKCDKIKNDLNYNTSQLRAGGSNVTQDRLNAERRQLNEQFTKDSCQA